MILLNSILKLNCTKEIFNVLLTAEKLSNKYSHLYVEPIHLFISILLTKNLVTSILNLNQININLLVKYFFFNYLKIQNNYITLKTLFSINSLKLLNKSLYKNNIFNSLDLFLMLLKENNFLINNFLKFLSKNEYNILNLFNIYKNNNIPYILKKYTYIPENNLKTSLIGRNYELNILIENLSKSINHNVLIVGNTGVGRTSLIYLLIKKIQQQKVPNKLKNKEIRFLNLINLIKDSQYKGDLEKNFNSLIIASKLYPNLILVCLDINYLLTLFNLNLSTEQDSLSSLTLFKSTFISKNFQLIGIISSKEFLKYKKQTFNLDNFFNILILTEPKTKDLFNILTISSLKLENFYNIKISPNIIEESIKLSKKYLTNKFFPIKALELLDTAWVKQINKKHYNNYLEKKNLIQALSYYSNIPTTNISKLNNKKNNIISLEYNLKKKIFGQNKAIEKISNKLKISYLGLKEKNKPLGSWILSGPSGTGKTELAKQIALILFGSEKEMIRFDMSEYKEGHSLSKLIGTPPGYVGYGEGGYLTEAVNKKPYCVILFDEIEKAHKDINDLMLQILDDGRLTDSNGNNIDFSNTIILFTSNLGCPKNSSLYFSNLYNNQINNLITNAIIEYFKPEFLNRLDDIIIFKPLTIINLEYICTKFLNNLQVQLIDNQNFIYLFIDYNVKLFLVKLAYNPLYGARPLKRLIEILIEKPISDLLINFNFILKDKLYFNISLKNTKLIYQIKLFS